MAKANKPIALSSKHRSKAEIQALEQAEESLQGKDDVVYSIPSDLTEEEKIVYKFLVDELKESGILTNLDIFVLRNTCFAVVGMQRVQRQLIQGKDLSYKANGELTKNPLHSALKDYEKTFQWCCKELALTPSSRSALASLNIQAKEQAEDPVLKALRGEL